MWAARVSSISPRPVAAKTCSMVSVSELFAILRNLAKSLGWYREKPSAMFAHADSHARRN